MAAKKKHHDLKQFSFQKLDDAESSDGAQPEGLESMESNNAEATALVLTSPEHPTRAEFREWFCGLRKDMKEHKLELRQMMEEIKEDMAGLGRRVDEMDIRLDYQKEDVNQIQITCTELLADNLQLKEKIADLENRARRGNLRFRGFPASPAYDNCEEVVRRFCNFLLTTHADKGTNPEIEIKFERIHRVLGPKKSNVSRDIIVCFHEFPLREQIFTIARKQLRWSWDGVEIAVFADFSQATLQNRFELKEATAFLRNANIKYRWQHPFGLICVHEGKSLKIRSAEEANLILKELGFQGTPRITKAPRLTLSRDDVPRWKRVGDRKSRLCRNSDGSQANA